MTNHNREEREALIEKAAKAMYFEDTGVDIEFAEWMEIERVEAHARAALAVFEQAHTSTSDDAEALANVLLDGREAEDGLTALRERILAAGFRRTVQGDAS